MTELLTYQIVLDAANRVVAARGADFIYNPQNHPGVCTYVSRSDPRNPIHSSAKDNLLAAGSEVCGCGVGEILVDLGILTDEMASYQGGSDALLYNFNVPVTSRAARFLKVFQRNQDNGVSWGDALSKAIEAAHTRLNDVNVFTW